MEHIPATAGTAETQTLSPHLSIRWCGSSHRPVIVTLVPLAHHGQGQHPAEHRNLHRPPCTGTNYHYRRERQNHRIYPARHDHPPHIGGRKSRPFKCKQPSGIPQRVSSQGSRTVNLTGEARFEVTKDAHRPFIVSADKMQTQVLGTVFDVNAYPGNAPAVTLYQGRVKVGKAASPIEKEIVPGQCATLTTSGDIRLAKATRTEKEGWTKDEFYYDNTEMITVLQNIGTWYNISVICHSADLLHKRVHFRFSRNVPIKTLLNVLNDLGIAHFQYKDKQIVVE